jgi:small basic protein
MESATREILKHLSQIIGRIEGPFGSRIFIQPLVASIIGARAGVKDAREGRPAYIWALLTNSIDRYKLMLQSWNDVAKVFLAAFTIDIIYEIIVLGRIYLGQSLIVAIFLALVPYMIVRGPANRIARRWLNLKLRASTRREKKWT